MILGVSSTEFQLRPLERESYLSLLRDLNVKEVRMVVYRNNHQTVLDVQRVFDHYQAQFKVSLVLVDLPGAIGGLSDVRQFSIWANLVAKSLPADRFVVHNEVNNTRLWKGSPALYESLLYRTRQKLKEAHNVPVSGFGLAHSHNPSLFLAEALKRSAQRKRIEPLMDEISLHPYPLAPQAQMSNSIDWVKKIMSMTHVPINCDEFGTLLSWEPIDPEKCQADKYIQIWNGLKSIKQVRSFYIFLAKDFTEGKWTSGLVGQDWKRKENFTRLLAR